jgi:hypothetical protein
VLFQEKRGATNARNLLLRDVDRTSSFSQMMTPESTLTNVENHIRHFADDRVDVVSDVGVRPRTPRARALPPSAYECTGPRLVRRPLGAAAIGIAGLVVLSLGTTLPTANPWFSTGLAEIARAAPIEGIGPDLDAARTISVSVGIVVVSLVLAWWRFRRVEV